jgi:hypothetical protein
MRASRRQRQERGRARTGQILRELLPWAPTLLGVCALIALLVIAGTRFTSSSSPAPIAVPGQPFLPAPTLPPVQMTAVSPVSAAVRPSASTPSRRQPRPSDTPAPPPTSRRPATTPAPSPGPVTGRYRVVDSYDDAFIGEVLVANSSGRDRAWRAELRFPTAVGGLITSWVESAPQATLRRSGDSFVWSSGVPVPAGAQVALRFHFSRSGSGNLPSVCTVNGVACAGVR